MREESIGEKIIGANCAGDIIFLNKMSDEEQFNPLNITEAEHWNYLHRANLINPSPKETIQFYLDKGVPVNAQDCYGMTPLHYAVRAHNFDGVKLLLEAGADPNIENQDKVNSLWQSVLKIPKEIDIPIIKLLIQSGADPLKKNIHDVAIMDVLTRLSKTRPYLMELVNQI